jgi:hypothetical protein
MRRLLWLLSLLAWNAAEAQTWPSVLRNPGFEEGPAEEVPKGWYFARGQKDFGFSSDSLGPGAWEGQRCARLSRFSGQLVAGGNLLQTLDAAPYRGKRIRLRSRLRVDGDPRLKVQMWLRVDHPDSRAAFFDNMSDRPVRSKEWQPAVIEANVAEDASILVLGFMVAGGYGSGLADAFELEVLGPAPAGPEGFPMSLVNGDFEEGIAGRAPHAWTQSEAARKAGFRAELREGDAASGSRWALIGRSKGEKGFGDLVQTVDATRFRGRTIRISGQLRLRAGAGGARAQLFCRIDGADGKIKFFNDMRDHPVTGADWTPVQIVAPVAADASRITVGFGLVQGTGEAGCDGLGIELLD